MRGYRFPILQRNTNLHTVAVCLALCLISSFSAEGQQAATPASLNSTVSDIGTSFVFSLPPVCAGCVETELGYLWLQDGSYLPAVITTALPRGHTDLSVLVNLLDSETTRGDRVTQFGNRVDFILRQIVIQKGGFGFTLAPRGTAFIRSGDGGRVGAAAAPQYGWGKNLAVVNVSWTAGIAVSPSNPRSDYVATFDYFRTLNGRGTAFFVGTQHEISAGQQIAGVEEGFVIPFRNGQVELATEQLDLNTGPEVQLQARVIVNWGKLLRIH